MEIDEEKPVDPKIIENTCSNSDTIANCDQILGSVTINSNNNDGSDSRSQQIRSSARVVKKMKIDHSNAVVIEKREKKEEKPDTKKCYRPLWTSDDKNMFFEALNEYGKDFESIHLYITSKLKKKGLPDNQIKTKDQVRHLYYRSWQKVAKYVRFDDGVKKVVQELYSLINYGELRKKIGSVSEKTLMKLNELIYTGTLSLRVKGKTIRIKTPMCRALRRLNQLDDKYDEINLPTKVSVELRPKDMASFLRVQSMAQNPRIRTVITLQKRLSTLMSFINKRWKTTDAEAYLKAITATEATVTCLPSKAENEYNQSILMPPLRLSPPSNCKIELPSINLSEYYTRQSICLASYENRIGIKSFEDEGHIMNYNFKFLSKLNAKKGFRQRTDSISDKSDKSPLKTETLDDENSKSATKSTDLVNEVVDEAVNTILALQQTDSQENGDCKFEENEVPMEVPDEGFIQQKKKQIEKIRRGWSEEESQTLTIGEIYLMFGSDSKLILEYSWDTKPIKNEDIESSKVEQLDDDNYKNTDLSESLSKLLSVAKLHYRKNIIKCPCGHICGQRKNVRFKRTIDHPKMNHRIITNIDKTDTDEVEEPIQWVKPRYLNLRGRKSKQLVVERKLPLLLNKVKSGHQIVRMNIISQNDNSDSSHNVKDEKLVPTNQALEMNLPVNDTIISHANEPSTSASLQILNSEEAREANQIINPLDSTEATRMSSNDSEHHSAETLLNDDDNQWINSEVADYSLSSLLGHLESPMKSSRSTPSVANDDSRLSQDVDVHLESLLTESSVDFSAKFADLAAVVTEIKK